MKGVPILIHTSGEVSLLMDTKKTSSAKVTINMDGIIDAYKLIATSRRTIHVQGKVVTVHIPGKVYNCDEDCFSIR